MITLIYSGEGDPCYNVIYSFEMETHLNGDTLLLLWEELTRFPQVIPQSDQIGLGFDGSQPKDIWRYYVRHILRVDDRKGLERSGVEESLWELWCDEMNVPADNLCLHNFEFVERRYDTSY